MTALSWQSYIQAVGAAVNGTRLTFNNVNMRLDEHDAHGANLILAALTIFKEVPLSEVIEGLDFVANTVGLHANYEELGRFIAEMESQMDSPPLRTLKAMALGHETRHTPYEHLYRIVRAGQFILEFWVRIVQMEET